MGATFLSSRCGGLKENIRSCLYYALVDWRFLASQAYLSCKTQSFCSFTFENFVLFILSSITSLKIRVYVKWDGSMRATASSLPLVFSKAVRSSKGSPSRMFLSLLPSPNGLGPNMIFLLFFNQDHHYPILPISSQAALQQHWSRTNNVKPTSVLRTSLQTHSPRTKESLLRSRLPSSSLQVAHPSSNRMIKCSLCSNTMLSTVHSPSWFSLFGFELTCLETQTSFSIISSAIMSVPVAVVLGWRK